MTKRSFLFATIVAMFVYGTVCAQKKKIYLAPDDHTDYMWSANEDGYKTAFLETLDYYINLNETTKNDAYNIRSKWNCDGSYWAYTYEKNRTSAQFATLIDQIKRGQITIPLNTLISIQGIAPAEATLRDMYYAGSLERKYGLNFELAFNMEDQVLGLGLSSLWAGAGAKYTWRGVCGCATSVANLDKRTNQIYWYKGLDDQKVLMKWHSIGAKILAHDYSTRDYFGTYLESRFPYSMPQISYDLMGTTKYPYTIAGAFGKGGDDVKTSSTEFIDAAKSFQNNANFEVIVSNEIDFFKDFEAKYGASLPSETKSYGTTEWGTAVASLAEVSASVKRSIEKLRAAEALYTLVALKDAAFASTLADKRQQAWIACGLYFEHDWTADGPTITRTQRASWQRKIAAQLIAYVDELYNTALAKLGTLIVKPNTTNEVFFVFNPLSWSRLDYSDYPYTGATTGIRVIDKNTSLEVPFQIITKKSVQYIRVMATDVPSLGYKLFEIQNTSAAALANAATVTGSVIENSLYKVTLTKQGVIKSLIDKGNSNKECVKAVNNLYFNDMGSGTGESGSALVVENAGPVSVTLVATADLPKKHTTKITLFKNSSRIEIENYITQALTDNIITYTFSPDVTGVNTWHEESGAILNVKPESQGGHYASDICRLDWIGLNHFVDMSGTGSNLLLSNRDAYFMKLGNSTISTLDYTTSQIKVLAAGRVTGSLGIQNQDGDSYFETFFAIKPHADAFDPTSSMKFSLEHQNPMVAGKVTGTTGYSDLKYSLFTLSDPNVLAWAVKPSEEGIGQGIILRVWNMNNANKTCTISSATDITSCKNTTHIEVDGTSISPVSGKVTTDIGHNRIQTFRMFVASATANREPENPANTTAGLQYSYYEGNWTTLPNFANLTPVKTGTVTNLDLTPRVVNDYFGFRFKGYVSVPTDGTYTFYTTSDDGSNLYIGNTLVVNNDGKHGSTEKPGSIGLKAGTHAITIDYFDAAYDNILSASYEGPGITKQAIPASAFSYVATKTNQTITFNALPTKTIGDSDFNPGATASSGLAVTYTSSNTGVATIVNGNIHVIAVGTSTITASQAGNATYNAATSVNQTLTVNAATSTNLIGNPSFTSNASGWSIGPKNGAAGTITSVAQEGKVTITSIAATPSSWDLQVFYKVPLTSGKTYSIKFKARAEAARTIDMTCQQNIGPTWTKYWTKYGINLTTTMSSFGPYTFTSSATDTTNRLKFLVGNSRSTIYIDDVEVTESAAKSGNAGIAFENNEINNENNVIIYPNPVSGILKADIQSKTGERITLQLFNLQGQLLHSNSYTASVDGKNTIDMNVQSVSNGTYLVKVTTSGGLTKTAMFVKQD